MPEEKLLVVNYHYIRENEKYRFPGIHSITPSTFIKQIDFFSQFFHISTPLEVEEFARGGNVFDRPSIFLTFDDGLVDHNWVATKILNEKDIKAGFFIPTKPLVDQSVLSVHKAQWLRAHTDPLVFQNEFISLVYEWTQVRDSLDCHKEAVEHYRFDSPTDAYVKYLINFSLPPQAVDNILSKLLELNGIEEQMLSKELYMSEEEILELHNSGHLIGAHSHRHIPLNKIESELSTDISENKEIIARITGETPTWISYPYGNQQSLPRDPSTFCNEYEFFIGLTMEPGWNGSNLAPCKIRRIDQNDIIHFTKSYSAV